MHTTNLVPPTLPPLSGTKRSFTSWLNEVRRRYTDFRLATLEWTQRTGGEQLVRYDNGLEILVSRNTHPGAPPWRATRFFHGRHDGHSSFETPSEALAQVLDQNRDHGQATVFAYTAADSFAEEFAAAA